VPEVGAGDAAPISGALCGWLWLSGFCAVGGVASAWPAASAGALAEVFFMTGSYHCGREG
jgi:hypothetical protein